MISYIVLGCKGFIGSTISEALATQPKNCFLDLPDFDLLNFDIKQFDSKYLSNDRNTVIINCVGLMGASKSQTDSVNFLKINGLYVQNLVEVAKSRSNVKLIQLSSETIYGNEQSDRSPDEQTVPKPINMYAVSKYVSEELIRLAGIQHIILRIPVVVGKNQVEQNAFSDIFGSSLNKTVATIFGDGEHVRKYVTASTLKNYIISISQPEFWNVSGTFNVPGLVISVNDILAEFREIHKDIRFDYLNDRKAYSLYSDHNLFMRTFRAPAVDTFADFYKELS